MGKKWVHTIIHHLVHMSPRHSPHCPTSMSSQAYARRTCHKHVHKGHPLWDGLHEIGIIPFNYHSQLPLLVIHISCKCVQALFPQGGFINPMWSPYQFSSSNKNTPHHLTFHMSLDLHIILAMIHPDSSKQCAKDFPLGDRLWYVNIFFFSRRPQVLSKRSPALVLLMEGIHFPINPLLSNMWSPPHPNDIHVSSSFTSSMSLSSRQVLHVQLL